MKLAIIGGAGKMGSWFANYFKSEEYDVVLSDSNLIELNAIAQSLGVEIAANNIIAVKDADIVLISVPLELTQQVISEVAQVMKANSVLAEISSIKSNVYESLLKAAEISLRPISLHPLFGPTAKSVKGNRILLVPVVDEQVELKVAKNLFREAELVSSSLEEHDKVMSTVLSIPYMMNTALAAMLKDEDLLRIRKFSGTTFKVQLAITESVISEHSNLVSSLLRENPYVSEYIDRFLLEIKRIQSLLNDKKEFDKYWSSLVESMERDPDFRGSDVKRYKAFKILESN